MASANAVSFAVVIVGKSSSLAVAGLKWLSVHSYGLPVSGWMPYAMNCLPNERTSVQPTLDEGIDPIGLYSSNVLGYRPMRSKDVAPKQSAAKILRRSTS